MSFLNKITKYFLVEFIKIFILILFSIAILIFIVDFLEFLPKMEKNSIPSLTAIKIVFFAIPSMLEEFFQFIILVAIVFTMAKIASKNELTVVNIILEQKMGEMVSSEILHRVEGLDNRTYKPRIRTDLFDL